jgi:misacylated tRNA(Ala) deacylase
METIFLKDSYVRSFDAVVEKVSDEGVVLNQTAFYPASGGQPTDLGYLSSRGDRFSVLRAEVAQGRICHHLDRGGLQEGDEVSGSIDWERRFRFMRSHTACHILSAIMLAQGEAKITGNQIDLHRSRVDFSLEQFDRSKMVDYVEQANEVIRQDLPVITKIISREEAMAIPELFRLAKEVPDREAIRVVEIRGVDLQACGGTHVKKTGEILGIRFVKAENKGRSNRRVYFELTDGD